MACCLRNLYPFRLLRKASQRILSLFVISLRFFLAKAFSNSYLSGAAVSYLYPIPVLDYPLPSPFGEGPGVRLLFYIIFSATSSFTSPSISASDPVSVFDSFAWNTMFFTAFTFVGEPARPHWLASPSTSATDHWFSVR